MTDRIMTLHPDPAKVGVNIDQAKYDTVRQAILLSLESAGGEMTFTGLTTAVGERLAGSFDGSISWYVTTVKLDLEARGLIARLPGAGPQRLRLKEG